MVIYFDFESFLRIVAECDAAADQSSTGVVEKHEPCGFALAVIDHHSNIPYFEHVDSSEDCMDNSVRMLHWLALETYINAENSFFSTTETVENWTKVAPLNTARSAKNRLTASLTPKGH